LAQQSGIFSNKWLDQRFDWVIYLEPKELEHYLVYPSSGLGPVTDVRMTYRVNPRLAANHVDSTLHYEDLWYHEGRPVGCRRFGKLNIQSGWQGAICISDADSGHQNTPAEANAIVRLILEINLLNCNVTAVLVPSSMVSPLCDAMGQFQFFRTDGSAPPGPSRLEVLVCSGLSDRNFMVYKP